jgi:hypothetical protein
MGITLLPPVCPLSAAVVESFRNGSEAMDSHDEFWEKYISNYYSERIGKFRNSLKRFQASLEKLKSETTRLKTEGESIVGVWTITSHPTDGQTNSVVVTFDAHGWGTARLTISGYADPGETSPFFRSLFYLSDLSQKSAPVNEFPRTGSINSQNANFKITARHAFPLQACALLRRYRTDTRNLVWAFRRKQPC